MSTEPMGRQNGAAIRAIRELSKMSPAELALAAGIKEQSLRNIENGTRPASDQVIYAIAGKLGVPVEAITKSAEAIAA